ncbi:DUF1998 domain-containing protein [Akkermansiaceae bacterium]|nr:DUF1998 domain-containing protein [Akkermansiaceae bacterium]
MPHNPNTLRRAQLIMPFGVGAVHMQPNGYSVVTAGLDDWFTSRDGEPLEDDQIERVEIIEPRLAAKLGVDHFRLPPSDAEVFAEGHKKPSVPVYRFPTWFKCGCGKLIKGSPDLSTSPMCPECDADRKIARKKPQIRFIAACDHGHLQEFPWLEWVHRSREVSAECAKSLTFSAKGGATLADIRVTCSNCKKSRNLSGITSGALPSTNDPEGSSILSSTIFKGEDKLLCKGECVWHGPDHSATRCGRPLRGILFNATNLHYSVTQSAIKIPDLLRTDRIPLAEIIDSERDLKSALSSGIDYEMPAEGILKMLRSKDDRSKLDDYANAELLTFIAHKISGEPLPVEEGKSIENEEFHVFRQAKEQRDGELVMVKKELADNLRYTSHFLNSVVAIEHLKETIAFEGFSRFLGRSPNAQNENPSFSDLIWKNPPVEQKKKWLPAVQQTGEGIFLEFDAERIEKWRRSPAVVAYFETLMLNQRRSMQKRGQPIDQMKGPEYVLIHTFSHLLINRLIFECGYGSASLKERIYADFDKNEKVAGLLIYTASGDSEGSMGGLVKLSDPETLERIISNALNEAQWCSADPVCKEAAKTGSGPDSLNYAACHNCAMLPETCCEAFNSLLDRSLFIQGEEFCFL